MYNRPLLAKERTSDNGVRFVRRQVKEEIVGEDRGASEKKISDVGVTNRFGALLTHPIGVRESLDRLDELDFCR